MPEFELYLRDEATNDVTVLELNIDATIGDILLAAGKESAGHPRRWCYVRHGNEVYRDRKRAISDTDITPETTVTIDVDMVELTRVLSEFTIKWTKNWNRDASSVALFSMDEVNTRSLISTKSAI